MAAAVSLWNPKLGNLPQLRKLVPNTDEEVAWWTERVRFYIRKNIHVVYAMDRAHADLKRRNELGQTAAH